MTWAALLSAALLLACNERGGADFERMLDQRKYRAEDVNPYFADGRTLRRPPPGTLPATPSSESPEILTGMSAELYLERVPIPLDQALLERGENRFAIFCAPCHGLLGDGRSKVAENMARRPAPSLHELPISAFPAGRLYRIVREGYGLMPPYEDALDVRERWAVVAYVEALKLSQRAPVSRLPREILDEARPWLK